MSIKAFKPDDSGDVNLTSLASFRGSKQVGEKVGRKHYEGYNQDACQHPDARLSTFAYRSDHASLLKSFARLQRTRTQ